MLLPNLIVLSSKRGTKLPFTKISLYDHHLVIDGEVVETHFDGTHYYWSRINSNNEKEDGVIKLFFNGMIGQGAVSVNGTATTFSVYSMFKYSINVDNQKWIDIGIGFETDGNGNKVPYAKFIIPDDTQKEEEMKKEEVMKKEEEMNRDLAPFLTLSYDEQKREYLTVSFAAKDVGSFYFSDYPWYAGELLFSMDYQTVTGYVFEFDPDAQDYRGPKHEVEGKFYDYDMIQKLKKTVLDFVALNPVDKPMLKSAVNKFPEKMNGAIMLKSNIEKSVEHLFTIPSPDMDNLHELSFSKMKALMLYAIDDDTRKWFGEKKPYVGPGSTLTQSDVDLLENKTIKTFLTDVFAKGYLTQAFSQSTEDGIKKQYDRRPGYEEKLNFFWKGNGKTCFANEKGYNIVSSALSDSAFINCVPELEAYRADRPHDWAEALYNYCIQPQTLNGLAMQNTLDGRKRITQLCSLLHALDHEKCIVSGNNKITFSTSLYKKVIDHRLTNINSNITINDRDEFEDFMIEFLKQYFTSLLEDGKWDGQIREAEAADLKKLMDEYGTENVNELVDKIEDIISNSVDFLLQCNNLPIPARLDALSKKYPVMKKIRFGLTLGVYAIGFMLVMKTFTEWKELKTQEKVFVIASTLDLIAGVVNDFAIYKSACKVTSGNATSIELKEFNTEIGERTSQLSFTDAANDVLRELDTESAGISEPSIIRGGEAAAEALVEEGGNIEKAASKWAKAARITGPIAEGLTILALGAACVLTAIDVVNDFKTGELTKTVLDLVQTIATGVAFLAEVGAGIAGLVSEAVCSVIPIIGVVATVIGVVLAIVSMFIHKDPPPTPEEEYVRKNCIPFLDKLMKPTQDWLDDQKKINDHLNNSQPQMA